MDIKRKKKVQSIDVKTNRSISELMTLMENTGFQGKSLAKAITAIEKMAKDPNITIFFGYAGSLSTTGQWKIINWFIENNLIDVLVPTGANISEDIVEAMGGSYIQSSHIESDSDLFKKGYKGKLYKKNKIFSFYPPEVFSDIKQGDIYDVGFDNLKIKIINFLSISKNILFKFFYKFIKNQPIVKTQ